VKLVIDIPEEEYRLIMRSDKTVFADASSKECMLHAIKNGTVLPKGHGDLIDRDLLHTNYIGTEIGTDCEVYLTPTVLEAEPVIPADK
jgi:hypothetical protein